MLIQVFAHKKEEVESVLKMIYSHFKSEIEYFEVDEMKNAREGFYRMEGRDSIEDVMADLNLNMNDDTDNVGVYFNQGKKLFIRLFKNAKFDADSYRME